MTIPSEHKTIYCVVATRKNGMMDEWVYVKSGPAKSRYTNIKNNAIVRGIYVNVELFEAQVAPWYKIEYKSKNEREAT